MLYHHYYYYYYYYPRLLTGGKDGKIIFWCVKDNADILKVSSFCISSEKVPPPIRAVALSSDGKSVVVGTQTCSVLLFKPSGSEQRLQITMDPAYLTSSSSSSEEMNKARNIPAFAASTSSLSVSVLITSHHTGELWGLAVNPAQPEYCTVGDDRSLRIWSIDSKREVRGVDMKAIARCCAYSPDGTMIAVGFGKGKTKEDGMFRVYRDDPQAGISLMYETKETKQWISEIKFSPDGRTLAVGSHGNSDQFYLPFNNKFSYLCK